METTQATTLFSRAWSLYDFITAHNYMSHREIYATVAQLVGAMQAEQGHYTCLDLGCGNARFMAPILRAHPPQRYMGVDLSQAALAEAEQLLQDADFAVEWRYEDLHRAVAHTPAGEWSVIFSGFAVHHLAESEKAQWFQAVYHALAPKGCLILVDIARQAEEDRASYLAGYVSRMRTHWTAVPPEQIEQACAHVLAHDFPETLARYQEMASAAGLTMGHCVAQHHQHHVLWFCADSATAERLRAAVPGGFDLSTSA